MAKRKPTPKCIHCGKNLPYHIGPTDQARMWRRPGGPPPLSRGVDGRGHFCKKGCAIKWANAQADKLYPKRTENNQR